MARKFLRIYFVGLLSLIFSWNLLIAGEGHDDHKEGEGTPHKESEKEEHGHAHGHEEKSPDFGAGKAITAVRDEGKSFQLSAESIKFLKIEFSSPQFVKTPPTSKFTLQIPKSSLVSFQDKTGVYVQEENWIELIEVKVKKRETDYVLVEADAFDPHSAIATKGVSFIRTAHLQASGLGGEGHAH